MDIAVAYAIRGAAFWVVTYTWQMKTSLQECPLPLRNKKLISVADALI